MSLELGWVCDHTIYSSIIIETHNFACASCEILVRILCGGRRRGKVVDDSEFELEMGVLEPGALI